MLTKIIILARLNETKDKISFLNEMIAKAKKLKGKDVRTPILDKRIYIAIAEARIMEWVLENGS